MRNVVDISIFLKEIAECDGVVSVEDLKKIIIDAEKKGHDKYALNFGKDAMLGFSFSEREMNEEMDRLNNSELSDELVSEIIGDQTYDEYANKNYDRIFG